MTPQSIRWCVEPGRVPPPPRTLLAVLRRFVCRHEWTLLSDLRFSYSRQNPAGWIPNNAGWPVGDRHAPQVSFARFCCNHCSAEKVIPHDRKGRP